MGCHMNPLSLWHIHNRMSCTAHCVRPPSCARGTREDKRSFCRNWPNSSIPDPIPRIELIETLAEAEDNRIINGESRLMTRRRESPTAHREAETAKAHRG